MARFLLKRSVTTPIPSMRTGWCGAHDSRVRALRVALISDRASVVPPVIARRRGAILRRLQRRRSASVHPPPRTSSNGGNTTFVGSSVLGLLKRQASAARISPGRSIAIRAIVRVGVVRQGCSRPFLRRLCLELESIQFFAAGRSHFFLGPLLRCCRIELGLRMCEACRRRRVGGAESNVHCRTALAGTIGVERSAVWLCALVDLRVRPGGISDY